MTRNPLPVLLAGALLAAPAAVRAQAADPAIATVDVLDAGLLSAMQGGASLGASGRLRRLEPVVERAFDFATMSRAAAGPAWSKVSPADQAAVARAFARFTAASYAKNFDSFSGERFTVDPKVPTRGPDKLVKSQLVSKSGSATDFTYRMRQSGGTWKIVDVFFNGAISQLATQSADFRATLAAPGGGAALAKKLNDKADALAKG